MAPRWSSRWGSLHLYPSVRARLRGTDLAKKQIKLKALSELPINKQIKVLDAIQNADLPDVGNVAQALAYLEGGVACDPVERRFVAVSKTIAALDDETIRRRLRLLNWPVQIVSVPGLGLRMLVDHAWRWPDMEACP